MSLLPILKVPDPRLRQVCAPVETFDATLARLADDMFQTMYDAPGRGLAGPQVGAMQRIFVMDTTWKEGQPTPLVCVNPVILGPDLVGSETSTEAVINGEACLSIPDRAVRIARPGIVTLVWQDLHGQARQGTFEGIAAVCVQHERDHLDGVLCTDYSDLTEPAA